MIAYSFVKKEIAIEEITIVSQDTPKPSELYSFLFALKLIPKSKGEESIFKSILDKRHITLLSIIFIFFLSVLIVPCIGLSVLGSLYIIECNM